MTEIMLFGACEMTPKRFAAMAPHLQTEAVRLMTECGHSATSIGRIAGAPLPDLMAAYTRAHQIRIRDEDRGLPPKGPRMAISATAKMILIQMLHQAGALASSLNSLSYDLGKSTTSVRHALQQLVAKSLIEMTVPPRGTGHPAQYRLTGSGEVLALELAAQPVESADA